VDGLWATKSKDVGLIVRAISFEDFQPTYSAPDPPTTLQTDRQTDDMQSQYRFRASSGKNSIGIEIYSCFMLILVGYSVTRLRTVASQWPWSVRYAWFLVVPVAS